MMICESSIRAAKEDVKLQKMSGHSIDNKENMFGHDTVVSFN